MSASRTSAAPVVSPGQVWAALTADSQTRAIALMASLASNVVSSLDDPIAQEAPPCFRPSLRRRSGPNTSTAPR